MMTEGIEEQRIREQDSKSENIIGWIKRINDYKRRYFMNGYMRI